MNSVDITTATAMVWSATRLKRYMTCPRQFAYAYIDGIPTVPTAPLVLGRVLHEAILNLHEAQMASGCLMPVDTVIEEFDRLWQHALQKDRPFFREGSPDAKQCAKSGREMLRAYHASQVEQPAPLLVEMAFEIMLGEYKMCGVIDRVDVGEEGLIITDLKSGRKAPSGEVERDLQLTIYAQAAQQVLGMPVERVVLHYLRDGSSQSAGRSEEDRAQLRDDLLPHIAGAVEREEFPLRPGYWCRWCDFRELCRAQHWTLLQGQKQGGDNGLCDASDDQHRQQGDL